MQLIGYRIKMQIGNLNKLPLHFFSKIWIEHTQSHTEIIFHCYYISLHQGWEHIVTQSNPLKMTALSMENSESQEDIS